MKNNSLAFESGSQVEHIIFILHGELDLMVKMDNGEEIIIDTLFQGCNVGSYSAICESSYTFYGRARNNINAYILSRESIEEFRKVLVELDDELALFERYSEANGLPVWDYKFYFDDNIQHPSVKERFLQSVRRLLIINQYKRTKKFRLSEMIGKLKGKMEEERRKLETKKEKEGMFWDEVSDVLSKHILQSLQSNTDIVDLFNHATKLDNLSNKIVTLFDQRDKLIRQLTTNLHLLANDLKTNASAETKKKVLSRIDTIINLDYDNQDLRNVGGNLQNNLQNYKSKSTMQVSQQRRSTINISPEEISKLKGKLVSMIKIEQDENPFKKVLKKKIAKYEQRLKDRSIKATKTQNFDAKQKSPKEDEEKRLNDQFEDDNELKPNQKHPVHRVSTMLKKQKTRSKKALL